LARVFARSVGAHHPGGDFGFCVNFLTLRVGDDLLDGVKEDFRNPFIFSRSPPSFDDGQFAFVLVVGSLRRQANGRDGLGELDGRVQRQDGDVVVVLIKDSQKSPL
jgi:hypothetical protein